MWYQKEMFTPEKEDFTRVLIFVRLYSLPTDYWPASMLKGIGDELGEYIKMSEGTKNGKNVSYARIYIYMDFSWAFPEAKKLVFIDVGNVMSMNISSETVQKSISTNQYPSVKEYG